MSDCQSDELGFISRKAFDEACQAVARCPIWASSVMSVENRRHVRSPDLSALALDLSGLLVSNNMHDVSLLPRSCASREITNTSS